MSSNTDDIVMDAVAVGSTSEREITRDAAILQGDGNDVVRMLLAALYLEPISEGRVQSGQVKHFLADHLKWLHCKISIHLLRRVEYTQHIWHFPLVYFLSR